MNNTERKEYLEHHELNTQMNKILLEIEEIRMRINKMTLEAQQLNLSNKKIFIETIFYPLIVSGGLTGLITIILKFFN